MSVTRISVWLGVSALLVGSVLPTSAQQQAKPLPRVGIRHLRHHAPR
jgi:hypothetical protein